MAHNQEEEASPLLPLSPVESHNQSIRSPPVETEKASKWTPPVEKSPVEKSEKEANRTPPVEEWTAEGHPIGHVSVVGQAVREQWSSGVLSCLGRADEFHSSDLEVCLLGSMVPCVLYGSNEERLTQEPTESFSNNCKLYTSLYVLGNFLFGWNCIAPWYSHTTRTAIRRKYNLEGSFESFARSNSCLGNLATDRDRLERMEIGCDLATHYLCHQCALCQEGRELRRRELHPGFYAARPVFSMAPPTEQTMARPDKS